MAETLLLNAGIAFLAIAIAGSIALRIGLSVIPAYILIGIFIGPNEPTSIAGFSLTLVENNEFIDVLAELGIVFLLFFLGLEFSIEKLLKDRNRIFKIGVVDFGINFTIGVIIGLLLGFTVIETLFIAGIVYISSSAVITKTIIENGWVVNPESDPILSTLVFEDILIAMYLALIPVLVLGQNLTDALKTVTIAFVFLGSLIIISGYGTNILEKVFSTNSDELFLLKILGFTTLVSGVAFSLGISEAVTAFFIGAGFGQTKHIEKIEDIIMPAKDLFAAVFFFSIGLTTDITLLLDVGTLLVIAVIFTTAGKLVSGTISGKIYKLNTKRTLRVAFGTVPRGEFSLIIGALAASIGQGALAKIIPAFAVGYVLIMSILGTMTIQYADQIINMIDRLKKYKTNKN